MWYLADLGQQIFDNDARFFPLLVFGVGGAIAIISIVSCTIRSILVTRAKEQTKRELAAYVAEGSLEPDKAVAMINAGRPHWEVGHGNVVIGAGKTGGKSGCCT